MILQPLPPLTIAGQVYEIIAVGPDLGTLTLCRAGEDEPVAVVKCRDLGLRFELVGESVRPVPPIEAPVR